MRVLVAYASRRGGTAGLAAMIGDAFAAQGWEVDVYRAAAVHDIDDYDAVVVASALYLNRWLREARRFVRLHAVALCERPVWLVSSGPLRRGSAGEPAAPLMVRRLMRKVNARAHKTFGGYLSAEAQGFLAHAMARTQAGDYRDAEQVRTWVSAVLASGVQR
ncbi:flavodoxin domain-containing protein [soil metagenome]